MAPLIQSSSSGLTASTFDFAYFEAQAQQPTSYSSSITSEATVIGDQSNTLSSNGSRSGDSSPRPTKRLKAAGGGSKSREAGKMIVETQREQTEANGSTAPPVTTVVPSRPRRVRTGCLTCRERHLKCDEAVPDCVNCRKSNRLCKRGVRLNFIDTQVQDPAIVPPTQDWNVHFQDESREIASEYKGGLGRYTALEPEPPPEVDQDTHMDNGPNMIGAPVMSHQQLPPIQSIPGSDGNHYSESNSLPDSAHGSHHRHTHSSSNSTYSTQTLTAPNPSTPYTTSDAQLPPQNETRDYLNSAEEVLFMQVFVEEVGLWMDSMDPQKHVRIKS